MCVPVCIGVSMVCWVCSCSFGVSPVCCVCVCVPHSQFLPDQVVATANRGVEANLSLQLALAALKAEAGGTVSPCVRAPSLPSSDSADRAPHRMPGGLYEPTLTRADHYRTVRKMKLDKHALTPGGRSLPSVARVCVVVGVCPWDLTP